MSPTPLPSALKVSAVFSASLVLLFGMGGCAAGPGGTTSPLPPSRLAVSGSVHGGQQPVSGASIALYAAGKTGTASAARSMLTAPVVSLADGSFSITGLYACQPGDQVYIVATGGNAGGGLNPAVALMTALGSCATLQANGASTFISINEVTTVASVSVLADFMSGIADVGSSPADANALAAAFAMVQTTVNTTTGAALATSTGQGIVPLTTINSLANSIATCINSTPGSASCSDLFSATPAGGIAPTNTVQSALNVAKAPTSNTSTIFNLATATPPFQPTLTSAPTSYAFAVMHPSDVLTYHNDNTRSGVQTAETVLTPANVDYRHFGKLFSFPVDSYLFAQPTYAGGVGMPDGAVHNLVFAASTRATVYAFDADGNNPAAGYMWKQSLLPTGERYASSNDYGCTNPPEAGVEGTPVLDRTAQTMYLVTKTASLSTGAIFQRIHAISMIDGTERPGSPQLINPTFAGTGDGSTNGVIPFNARSENNRSALLLRPNASGGKTVWIAYASHCDIAPYHGDVLGYDASTLRLTASFNDTPNGHDGGIWMGAGGLSADAAGYIYALVGNGTFDANTGGADYGDSALKLAPPASGSGSTAMSVASYFTPSNQATLQTQDADLGGNEGLLFQDPASGVASNLLVASDKNGYVYLLNTASLGGYDTGSNGIDGRDGSVQSLGTGTGFIWNFAFFNNVLYTSNPLKAFTFKPGTASTAGQLNAGITSSPAIYQAPPVVSANGSANAILWAEDLYGTLYAVTPSTMVQLYNSGSAPNSRDTTPTFVKFTSPVVANGKVYLSGHGSIAVYGLLP